MGRWTFVTCAVLAASVCAAAPAFADKVTLSNGDVLHGEVKTQGGRVVIEHAILGRIEVAQANVAWITREGETPPDTVPPTTLADRCSPCGKAEDEAAETCPSPWDFAIGFNISNEAGNTEKFGFGTDLEAGYTWGPNELRWRLVSFYEEAAGVQTEGKYFSNFTYKRRVSPRGRVFGAWTVDRDDFADIEIRNGLFAGYQYDFIKRKRTTFSGALGAGWVTEKRKNQEVFNTTALLAELEYKHEFASGDSFEGRWYVIPYLDNTELSPMRLELRYAHPLRDHFDLVVGFLADYVPDPPGDIESLDTKITFGIRWKK